MKIVANKRCILQYDIVPLPSLFIIFFEEQFFEFRFLFLRFCLDIYKHGHLCQFFPVRRVKYPQFSGVDSFLTLPRLTNGYKEFEIFMKFKPSSDSGLLLFTSEHPTGKGDFFSLALVNGHVEFRCVFRLAYCYDLQVSYVPQCL